MLCATEREYPPGDGSLFWLTGGLLIRRWWLALLFEEYVGVCETCVQPRMPPQMSAFHRLTSNLRETNWLLMLIFGKEPKPLRQLHCV